MSNAVAFRSLAQDIARAQEERSKAHRERTKRVAEIKKETTDLLKGFDNEHSEMSAQLKSELAKSKAEIKKGTADLLKGFDKAHSEMASQLKSELARVKPELAKGEKARRSEVAKLLQGFRRDSAEAAAAWRELVATMQAKRGVAVAPPPVKPRGVVEEEVPLEEIFPEERARLENRILALIREHPEGVRLTGIAEATGEARVKVGNITRMLVDEGKIRKEGLLYFPV